MLHNSRRGRTAPALTDSDVPGRDAGAMSHFREADASPPPSTPAGFKPERPTRSPKRQPSNTSVTTEGSKSSNGNYHQGSTGSQVRYTSVGLDVLGAFSRRKSGDLPRPGGASNTTTTTATAPVVKSPALASLARQERHTRTNSLPSHSSSSSGSSSGLIHKEHSSSQRPNHSPRSQSLQSGVTLRRKTNIADPARSQRFINQVNQVLSPPVSPEKGSLAKREERRLRDQAAESSSNRTMPRSEEEKEDEDLDLTRLDALKIHNDVASSGSGTARSGKRSSIASSLHSDHTESRRQQRYSQHGSQYTDEESEGELSAGPRSSTRPDRQSQTNSSSRRRSTQVYSSSSARRHVRLDQSEGEEDGAGENEAVPPLPTTPFPTDSQRNRGSHSTGGSSNGANRKRPPIPSEFGMRPKHEDNPSLQSPSYLSPRDPTSGSANRRDRAISPVSPTVSTTSLSKAGSMRLKQQLLQQGDADWLPPAPPAAYPQHYQTSASVRERERERKSSLLSSGSGGQQSTATSGSGGSGSRDDVDRRRSSSSALLRRSESPPSTVSSRYAPAARAPHREQHEDPLPPRPGSAAWWNELDDIKAKAKFSSRSNSVALRSQSRQSFAAADHQDDEDGRDHYPVELERTPVAASRPRRGLHPRAASVMEGPTPNSAPSRLRSTADFHQGGGGTMPRSRTAMGLNGLPPAPVSPADHRTAAHTISRGTPAFSTNNNNNNTPLGLRRFYDQNNTSSRSLPSTPNYGSQRRPPLKTTSNEHHRLLAEAVDYLERTTSHEDTPEYVRKMSILSDLTTTLNLELRTLVADLVEAQVEAEMDIESSGHQSTSADESMKKVEKRLARLLRNSDEQVRSLTEGTLALARREKKLNVDATVRGHRPESRATHDRRPSLDDDAYTARGSMDSDRHTARPLYDESQEYDDGAHDSSFQDRSLGSTMTRAKSLQVEPKSSRRHQSRSEATPAARNGSRRNKDSTGTVRPSPSFHYPRHSVASVSGVSGETADPGISPTHYARTRAISLDSDHYDYSSSLADDSRQFPDEDETISFTRARARRGTQSSTEEDTRGSSSLQGAAATALRLGLNTLTGQRNAGRRYRQN